MIDKQRLGMFVIGGAVGALVGILLAPRTGRELRSSIVDRAGEARDRSRESYFETQERLRERLAEMGEAGSRLPEEEELVVGPDSGPGQEPPFESDTATPPLRGGLRDVSVDAREPDLESLRQPTGQTDDRPPVAERSEELRRKIQETRDRLRRHTEDPGGQD